MLGRCSLGKLLILDMLNLANYTKIREKVNRDVGSTERGDRYTQLAFPNLHPVSSNCLGAVTMRIRLAWLLRSVVGCVRAGEMLA
jgi:hypothetical protein